MNHITIRVKEFKRVYQKVCNHVSFSLFVSLNNKNYRKSNIQSIDGVNYCAKPLDLSEYKAQFIKAMEDRIDKFMKDGRRIQSLVHGKEEFPNKPKKKRKSGNEDNRSLCLNLHKSCQQNVAVTSSIIINYVLMIHREIIYVGSKMGEEW